MSFESRDDAVEIDERQASATVDDDPPSTGGLRDTSKRSLDVAAALLLFALAWPLIGASILAVRLTSAGPAIYTQVRLGRGRRPFTIYKIRSMYADCERTSGIRWSTGDDPRVTPVGRFLRITHLDELPQLWNVLRGDMSLVGPRPERPEIASGLEIALPAYAERLTVRPGVTGLAQVQLAPDATFECVQRKLVCDLHYIDRSSLWLDLRLILATAAGVIGLKFALTNRLLRLPRIQDLELPAPVAPEPEYDQDYEEHDSGLCHVQPA